MKENDMGTRKITGLMISMAIPSVIAQVINILYSIIDRIYIGHIEGIGVNALTGVGLTFPIITMISAFSTFTGAGGAPLSAIWLGKGDKKRAEKILGNGIFLLLLFTILLTIIFYYCKKPFLYAFGASDATYPYADTYISIYLMGTIFVELGLGLNPYIICQGKSRIAMLSILIGAVTNIILDPIFIFVFHMGVEGAAIATVISQALSAIWIVLYLIGPKTTMKIRLSNLSPNRHILWSIFSLGISPFIMRSTESLISIVLNHGLQLYGGDLYVGSLTVMQSVMQLIYAPIAGFTQGVQPIISYNYGAQKFDRVRMTYRQALIFCGSFSFIATGLVMLFPSFVGGFFTTDAALLDLIAQKMPLFISGLLIFGLQQTIQPTFLALGQARVSLFIAILRKIILLIPLALILPLFFGVQGIYLAEPISDITSAIIACTLFVLSIRKILTKESLEKIN